ncbi:hypothetical protein Drorol1_Dr00019539 [Drosera rotundifolia]
MVFNSFLIFALEDAGISKQLESDAGFSKQVKFQAPLHYILRVESVSSIKTLLAGREDNSITSAEFCAGAYTWVLKIVWNEKERDEGNGHISMYLRLVDKLKPDQEVVAMFRFYVYNQKLDNYYTVQDATGKYFSPVKPEWGISRVLPLSVFTDASSGYIVNDRCIFGVDVFSPSRSARKAGTLAVVEKEGSRKYTWKVENFSSLQEYKHDSPIFTIDGISWSLTIHPKGDKRAKGESITIFLNLKDHGIIHISAGDRVFAKYALCIKDQHGNNDHRMWSVKGDWFDANTPGWGFIEFLLRTFSGSEASSFNREVTFLTLLAMTLFIRRSMLSMSGRRDQS